MTQQPSFEDLYFQAMAAPLEGWDFSWLSGRIDTDPLPWSYDDRAADLLLGARNVLDVDTGGGELLASLLQGRRSRPDSGGGRQGVVATEGWAPNMPVAADRLRPYGVSVVPAPDDVLPVPDASVDLVLNRHGRLHAAEIARALAPEGRLLTQQVGSDDCAELNAALGARPAQRPGSWSADVAVKALRAAGFTVSEVLEGRPVMRFADIAAVVYQLRAVPWQLAEGTVADYRVPLERLDERLRAEGGLFVRTHRFLIVAGR